ncbi:hypothetical protein [Streptomyces griseus]
MLVATFTLEEDAGDLSETLQKDYSTTLRNESVRISGKFTRIRSRIPWARPKKFSTSHSFYTPQFQKRDACEDTVSALEDDCWKWLSGRFPGRFSVEPPKDRPGIRIFLTQSSDPFDRDQNALSLLGLGPSTNRWAGREIPGWSLSFDNWRAHPNRRFQAIAAARRSEASVRSEYAVDSTSVWALTQEFDDYQSGFAVRWAMDCLLSTYSYRLGKLRDRSATRRRIDTPVRSARELDQFLLGDGLDAATVASETKNFAEDSRSFRYDAAEYVEVAIDFGKPAKTEASVRKNGFIKSLLRVTIRSERERESPGTDMDIPKSRELNSVIRDSLINQSDRLIEDMRIATTNIGASAGLRQAIANTRMQRAVVFLAFIATASGVLGAWAAIRG